MSDILLDTAAVGVRDVQSNWFYAWNALLLLAWLLENSLVNHICGHAVSRNYLICDLLVLVGGSNTDTSGGVYDSFVEVKFIDTYLILGGFLYCWLLIIYEVLILTKFVIFYAIQAFVFV